MKKNGTKLTLGLGVIKNVKDLRDKVTRAKNNPTELTNLLCKDFNIRQNEQNNWLTLDIIENKATFDMEKVYNTYCVRRCRFIFYNRLDLQYIINRTKRYKVCIATIFYTK